MSHKHWVRYFNCCIEDHNEPDVVYIYNENPTAVFTKFFGFAPTDFNPQIGDQKFGIIDELSHSIAETMLADDKRVGWNVLVLKDK
jgi:hypothetical protein